MTPTPSEEFLRPYRDALARHGAGFEATLWGSAETQRLRFDVMLDLADLDGRVVLDVGCGPGELAAHLHRRGIAFDRYVGYDAFPEMIEAARERGLERSTFAAHDVLAEPGVLATAGADVACISGTLNTMPEDRARDLVAATFEASAHGVVFNFLSDRPHARWADRDLTPARRFDTARWLDWSLGLTSRVAFTQAYLDGHDATIALWHDGE